MDSCDIVISKLYKEIGLDENVIKNAYNTLEESKNRTKELKKGVNKAVGALTVGSVVSGIALAYLVGTNLISEFSRDMYVFSPDLNKAFIVAVTAAFLPGSFLGLYGCRKLKENYELRKKIKESEKETLEIQDFIIRKKEKINSLIRKQVKGKNLSIEYKRELLKLRRELLGGAHIDDEFIANCEVNNAKAKTKTRK